MFFSEQTRHGFRSVDLRCSPEAIEVTPITTSANPDCNSTGLASVSPSNARKNSTLEEHVAIQKTVPKEHHADKVGLLPTELLRIVEKALFPSVPQWQRLYGDALCGCRERDAK